MAGRPLPQALLQLLDSLPGCFRNTKTTESCLHSAVEAASLAMKHIGGKIVRGATPGGSEERSTC